MEKSLILSCWSEALKTRCPLWFVMEYEVQSFACPACRDLFVGIGTIQRGFASDEDVKCPKDGTLMGSMRCDNGFPDVQPWDGQTPLMSFMRFDDGEGYE